MLIYSSDLMVICSFVSYHKTLTDNESNTHIKNIIRTLLFAGAINTSDKKRADLYHYHYINYNRFGVV